jgi:hypothetical protein
MKRDSIPRRSVTMQVSPKSKKKSRSKIGSIATAVAFTLVIGSFGVGSAHADNHRGDDRGRGGDHIATKTIAATADLPSSTRPGPTTITRHGRTTMRRLSRTTTIGLGQGTTRRRPRVSTSSLAFDREDLSTVVSQYEIRALPPKARSGHCDPKN